MPLTLTNQPPYYTLNATLPAPTTSTTLTNTQILDLYATPIEVIPAPGAGKVIQLITCLLIANFSTADYTNTAGAYYELTYDGGDTTTNSVAAGGFNGSSDTGITTLNHSVEDEVFTRENTENKAIMIYLNASGNLTGGDPANTLKVVTQYLIIDL